MLLLLELVHHVCVYGLTETRLVVVITLDVAQSSASSQVLNMCEKNASVLMGTAAKRSRVNSPICPNPINIPPIIWLLSMWFDRERVGKCLIFINKVYSLPRHINILYLLYGNNMKDTF